MAQNAIPEYEDLDFTPRARPTIPPAPPRDAAAAYEPKVTKHGFFASVDTALIVTVGMLLALGALMVYSTTFDWSYNDFGSETAILLQHLRNMAIGLVVFTVTALLNYRVWKRFSLWLLLITVGTLIAVLVFSDQVFGARRSFLNGSYQPGELAELTVVVYMAAWLSSKGTKVHSFFNGLLPFAALLGFISVLIMLQPDISTAVTLIVASSIMYFLAGANLRFLAVIGVIMAAGGYFIINQLSYASDRLSSFTAGITDLTQTNYHAQQAIIAFMNGGWTGVGLGQGRQKFGFLPAPHTDSIFAVIGEELGVVGAAFVVFLFIILVFRGFTISRRASDSFGSLLAAGVTIWIITKAMMNIAVMLNVLPSTGVALPFISFGGSSLVTVLAGAGLLVSVSRYSAQREKSKRDSSATYDRGRGTGGHVYPALAAAEALLALRATAELSFVGSVGGFERPLIRDAGFTFNHYDEVRAGPLHGVRPLQAVRSALEMAIGTVQALGLLRRRKPDALLLTGGWVGLPAALAARLLGVPSLIYLPDIEPGLAIKRLAPLTRRVATTVADSAAFFPAGKTVVTGYPLRAEMRRATREAGIAHFKLDPARPTLLVFGGSRGARTINQALLTLAPELIAAGAQIIHVTGTLDWEADSARHAALAESSAETAAHYHLFPYLHSDMGLAMAAADLAVCRSGASTLGELPFFGLPAILVPYPYAWRYQKTNADWLAARGAGRVLRDEAMTEELGPALLELLGDRAQLDGMRAHCAALAQPEGAESADGAYNLARELLRLAGDNA